MPRNGTGTYSLPQPPFVAGTVISSAAVNSDFSDIAIALTGSLPRDGQAGMTGAFKAADGSSIAPSITFSNQTNTGFFRPADDEIGIIIDGVELGTFSSSGLNVPVTSGVPIGAGMDYFGSTIPTTWYQCYGQAVSRTTYALLFTAIGVIYGSGDGASTFNLPDSRGSILVGADAMGGTAANRLTTAFFGTDPTVVGNRGGSQSQTLLLANLPPLTPAGTITNGHISSSSNSLGASGTQSAAPDSGNNLLVNFGPQTITSTQATSTFAGTVGGGTSTAFGIVMPSLIVNKIIYAGA